MNILKRWFEILLIVICLIFIGWLVTWKSSSNQKGYTTADVAKRNLTQFVNVTGNLVKNKDDEHYLEAFVSEKDLLSIENDDETEIIFDAKEDTTLTGKVRSKSDVPVIHGNATDYKVEMNVNDLPEEILLGMHAQVNIITDKKNDVISAPSLAIKKDSGQYYVEKVMVEQSIYLSKLNIERSKELRKKVLVEIGFEGDEFTEIKSGLKIGDMVAY